MLHPSYYAHTGLALANARDVSPNIRTGSAPLAFLPGLSSFARICDANLPQKWTLPASRFIDHSYERIVNGIFRV